MVSLVSVRVLSSSEVVASVIPLVVSSSQCPVPIDIHGNGGVVHPARGVRRIVLRCVLSLGMGVVPLRSLLLRGECSKGSISSEYVP